MKKLNLFKKVSALCMALMLVAGVTASAAVPGVGVSVNNVGGSNSVQNIAIATMSNNLTKGTSGKLTCEGATTVRSGYYAEVVVELQKYDGGWYTIATWSDTDSDFASVSKTYTATSGYSYRLRLTHTAYDRNWNYIESFVKFSRTV